MRLEHIFGDLESEAVAKRPGSVPFARPKAEGLFGKRRDVKPARPEDAEVEDRAAPAPSSH